MVKTYSSPDKLPIGIRSLGDTSSACNFYFKCVEADETDRWILKTIDNAEIVDPTTNLIKTPYGLCSTRQLSSGCKAALVANYMKKHNKREFALDVYCGGNALDIIYQILDNTEICIIQHRLPTYDCEWQGTIDYDDGRFIGKPFDLMGYLL